VQALDRVSLTVEPGEIVGLVGESGSGKSVLSYAISGLLDPAARVIGGEIRWRGTPVGPVREHRTTRAAVVQIFQNPRASLNPIRTVGRQLADLAGRDQVASLLESVRLDAGKAYSYRSSSRAANVSASALLSPLHASPNCSWRTSRPPVSTS